LLPIVLINPFLVSTANTFLGVAPDAAAQPVSSYP
jgi:hypothetical protein